MKAKEIKEGAIYMARVSGKIVPVKILRIFTRPDLRGREVKHYECQNTVTKRNIKFRSAQRFRYEVADR